MTKRRFFGRLAILVAVALTAPALAQSATMTGSLFMGNPSTNSPTRHQVNYNTTVGTTGTGAARGIQIPANQWFMSGLNQRRFPGFAAVAQNTEVYSTSNPAANFSAGNGAGSLAFCPQISPCSGFAAGTVAPVFLGVTPGPNTFGGAFRLLRHIKQGSGAWFVYNPGVMTPTKLIGFNPNLRGVSRTSMNLQPVLTSMGASINTSDSPWSGGVTNGVTVVDVNPVSLVYANNFLSASGGIQTLGTFQSTGTNDAPDGFATGFKMTTGTMSGSDATPPTTMGGPFTFTSMGYDNRDSSGNGYIQMVGGSVAYGGATGNNFFRISRLRMAVPEPTSGLALAAGLVGAGLLAGARRRRS